MFCAVYKVYTKIFQFIKCTGELCVTINYKLIETNSPVLPTIKLVRKDIFRRFRVYLKKVVAKKNKNKNLVIWQKKIRNSKYF